MKIKNKKELEEAKEKLANMIDRHNYEQMLAGDSKIPIDPQIQWLHDAIKKAEEEGFPEEKKVFSPFGSYSNNYGSYATANMANDDFEKFENDLPELDIDFDFEEII